MLVQFHRFHTAHSIPIRDSIKLWYHVHRVESPVQLYSAVFPSQWTTNVSSLRFSLQSWRWCVYPMRVEKLRFVDCDRVTP